MYMTIRELYEQLGKLLKTHPEVDPNMLVMESDVVDELSSGDHAIGTVRFTVAEKAVTTPMGGTKMLNPWTLYVYTPQSQGKIC